MSAFKYFMKTERPLCMR